MAEANTTLLAKLTELEAHFDELQKQIADPAFSCDSAKLIALSKEQGKLKGLVAKYPRLQKSRCGGRTGRAPDKQRLNGAGPEGNGKRRAAAAQRQKE